MAPGQALRLRTGADGSFSLWSDTYREGFHSGRGARREAIETFVTPSQLDRFQPGARVKVVEVCVGTGSNLAALLEACRRQGLLLDWIGLELDPEPLRLAMSQPAFCAAWPEQTLEILEQLQQQGCWPGVSVAGPDDSGASCGGAPERGAPARTTQGETTHGGATKGGATTSAPASNADGLPSRRADHANAHSRDCISLRWGDARRTLLTLQLEWRGQVDLLWHDAFSPQRCPELWTLEFLGGLATLLKPDGRWLSYSSAAAVREALRLAGLQLAALAPPPDARSARRAWSGGTVASPMALGPSALWRPLTPMEEEHLGSSAGEPYRDPSGTAAPEQILGRRQQAQAAALASGCRSPSSAWRRRWGVKGHG